MATPEPSAAVQQLFATAGVALWLFVALAILFQIVCNWIVATKAGYSGVLSLLMLIPLVNIVIFLIFVFSKWPIHREMDELRARLVAQTPPGGYVPPPAPPGSTIQPT